MLLLLNKVPPGTDTQELREKIEAMYGAEVAGVLPLNTEMVRLASGEIFTNRFPDHPFSQELQGVAKRILE